MYWGRGDPEEGALLLAAIEAECERSAERPEVDPLTRTAERPLAARRADAVAEIIRASLAGEPEPERSAERSTTVELGVHVDAEVLVSDGPGRCELEHGPALAPETIRRLACDAILVTFVDGLDGTPLDVGRRTRKISARLRRAVLARDCQCVFPGCHRTRVEIHHRIPWSRGGRTDLDNLDALCPFHHRLVHEGGWTMCREDDGRVVFRRPDGTVLDPTPTRTGPHDGDLEHRNGHAGLTITPSTVQPKWHGDPLHLDWAVADLCRSREQGRAGNN